jgi:hypothetical protein
MTDSLNATAPAPGPAPEPEAARYERMFNAAVVSLAEISAALGIPDEEAAAANGNELILERIDQLRRPLAGNYRATTDLRGNTVVEAHLPFINGLNAWVMVADLGKPEIELDQMCAMPDREVLAAQIVNALGATPCDPAQAFTEPGERRWSRVMKTMAEAVERCVRAFDTGTAEDYGNACIAFDDVLAAELDRVTAHGVALPDGSRTAQPSEGSDA